MSEAQKDTIYVDVDDEITSIIDKVKDSKHKIVALVLPKRATMLQSIVNMKLLKRSADSSKKKLVLITSEAGLMPLAGAVGMHVAKNLQSKPEVPSKPEKDEVTESLVNEEEIEDPNEDPDIDADKSVGELSGKKAETPLEAEESIDIDNTDDAPAKGATAAGAAKSAKKADGKKDKKLKVPNFDRFRKWLIIGGIALVVLLVGGYFAFFSLPKAKITITTDTTDVNANVVVTADTTTKKFNEETNTVPAEKQEVKKTESQSAPATGQKNNGAKATGSVNMIAKQCGGLATPPTVSSGTGISSGGQTYITQEAANFSFDSISGGCINFKANGIDITAQNGGSNYNVSGATFTVSGRADVTAQGSASGGSDNMVKVVSQADVDSARNKLSTTNNEQAARDELTKNLTAKNMMPIKESFATVGPNVTATPAVGEQADSVTVNSVTTYTMLGVNQDDLNTLVDNAAKKEIDQNKQSVQDNGVSGATFVIQDNSANPKITVQSTAVIGPKLDTDGIKQEVAGKKKGETIQIISTRPGIKDVEVSYSPFWVGKTPKKASKITIEFKKASNNGNEQ